MTETVNLKAYWDRVSRFSQYPEDKRADGYALGLLAEAGEVCGVVDKWLRGKYDEAEMKRRLLDELGDVCWYAVAGLALLNEDDVYEWKGYDSDPYADGQEMWWLKELMNSASYYGSWGVLDVVDNLSAYAGSTLQAVLDANVAKLEARHDPAH